MDNEIPKEEIINSEKELCSDLLEYFKELDKEMENQSIIIKKLEK